MKPNLTGTVALVAGATRGAGRGIAVELGAAGARVYCTGRSVRGARSDLNRPETIEETAELVTQAGGHGIAVRVDHSDPLQVRDLLARIDRDEGGRLDVLVNDIWGGEHLVGWGKPFWEHSLDDGLLMLRRAIDTHLITSAHAAPLMVRRRRGLVVEVTDGITGEYRTNLFYDLVKASVRRIAFGQAEELRPHGVTALALSPGFLRSEFMLEHFGVTEANWREGVKADEHFIASESPGYVGRAVVALAADPDVLRHAGKTHATWTLYREYGFTDRDGSQPDWEAHYAPYREAAAKK